jgi:hypothetical protein
MPKMETSATHYRRIDWSRADWTLPDAELARRMGASYEAAVKWRRRQGIAPPQQVEIRLGDGGLAKEGFEHCSGTRL